jgi:NAD(P)-dependent dehydrogenase (short-subunit alcohol dehydrogenase family)
MRLKDKVAIITGGGVGIGEAIALRFAAEGAAVAVAARNMSRLDNVAGKIRADGGRALALQTDVSVEEQVKRMVASTIDEYGKVDILVNNSGIAGPTLNLVDLSLEDWNETLAIDLTGTMLCSREALKNMIPNRTGSIVNITSILGTMGLPMRTPYCSAKWGMIGFTQAVAKEVSRYNIRANCIAPGRTEGERMVNVYTARAAALGITYGEALAQDVGSTVEQMGRATVTADEVAKVAVFLVTDDSSGITGRTFLVDAGGFL